MRLPWIARLLVGGAPTTSSKIARSIRHHTASKAQLPLGQELSIFLRAPTRRAHQAKPRRLCA